ncbi:MAG: maleate cis-trans isomerase family protein [Pikeienuella sp.]
MTALPFTTEAAYRATLGVIVLQSDETLEAELRRAMPTDISLLHSRIPSEPDVTPETLAMMEKALPEAARLLPAAASPSVIAYACTSGATVIGRNNVAAAIHRHHPGIATTDPMTAVVAALRALDAKRIGLLTPYVPAVSARMQALLEEEGFEIAAFASYEQEEEAVVARISETSTLNAVKAMPRVDAIFASCTNLRTFGIIETAEAATDTPVISSNSALAWHMLRLAGVRDASGPGRLFHL